VPTSFIYGVEDWMDFRGAEEARKLMNVPCEIIRVPQVKLLRQPVYPPSCFVRWDCSHMHDNNSL
jgi:hypothetical protein